MTCIRTNFRLQWQKYSQIMVKNKSYTIEQSGLVLDETYLYIEWFYSTSRKMLYWAFIKLKYIVQVYSETMKTTYELKFSTFQYFFFLLLKFQWMQIVYTRQDCETGTTYHALQSSISVGCALKLNYNIEYVLLNKKINKALREKNTHHNSNIPMVHAWSCKKHPIWILRQARNTM